MNWMGGQLNRHSKRPKDASQRRQMQHFTRVQAQKNATQSSSPFRPNYLKVDETRATAGQNQPFHSITASAVDTRKKSSTIGPFHLPGGSSQDRSDGKNSPKRLHYNQSTVQPIAPVSYSSEDLETKKRKLLSQRDWGGLAHTRPVQIKFTPRRTSSFAKRRKVTQYAHCTEETRPDKVRVIEAGEHEDGYFMSGALPVDPGKVEVRIGESRLHSTPCSSGHGDRFALTQKSRLSSESMLFDAVVEADVDANYGEQFEGPHSAQQILSDCGIESSNPIRPIAANRFLLELYDPDPFAISSSFGLLEHARNALNTHTRDEHGPKIHHGFISENVHDNTDDPITINTSTDTVDSSEMLLDNENDFLHQTQTIPSAPLIAPGDPYPPKHIDASSPIPHVHSRLHVGRDPTVICGDNIHQDMDLDSQQYDNLSKVDQQQTAPANALTSILSDHQFESLISSSKSLAPHCQHEAAASAKLTTTTAYPASQHLHDEDTLWKRFIFGSPSPCRTSNSSHDKLPSSLQAQATSSPSSAAAELLRHEPAAAGSPEAANTRTCRPAAANKIRTQELQAGRRRASSQVAAATSISGSAPLSLLANPSSSTAAAADTRTSTMPLPAHLQDGYTAARMRGHQLQRTMRRSVKR